MKQSLRDQQREELNKLKRQQEKELQEAWRDQFPNGEFVIRRGVDGYSRGYNHRYFRSGEKEAHIPNEFRLCWNSHSAQDFALEYSKADKQARWGWGHRKICMDGEYSISQLKYYDSSWGRYTTKYNSLEKFITATKKFGVPPVLVDAFVKQYNERFDNGYICKAHAECRENQDMAMACSESQKINKPVVDKIEKQGE